MLFEYAVEPKAIGSSWENFRYLIEKFGFDRGRLISRFPKKWEKKVIQEAKAADMPPIRLASLVDRLKRAKSDRFIDLDRAYDHELEWLTNAIKEDKKQPFHAIISAQKNASDSVWCIDDLDEDHERLKCSRDHKIPRTGEEIANALTPLFLSAKTVLFIDPYFDVSNTRNRETLKCCLEVLALNRSESFQCEVHFGDMHNNVSTEVIEREANQWMADVIPADMSVIFFSWKKKDQGADFHDRFLLTEKGGVKLGAGFIAKGAHQTVNMSLYDTDKCEIERVAFRRDSSVYDLIDPVIEVFSNGQVVRL